MSVEPIIFRTDLAILKNGRAELVIKAAIFSHRSCNFQSSKTGTRIFSHRSSHRQRLVEGAERDLGDGVGDRHVPSQLLAAAEGVFADGPGLGLRPI